MRSWTAPEESTARCRSFSDGGAYNRLATQASLSVTLVILRGKLSRLDSSAKQILWGCGGARASFWGRGNRVLADAACCKRYSDSVT